MVQYETMRKMRNPYSLRRSFLLHLSIPVRTPSRTAPTISPKLRVSLQWRTSRHRWPLRACLLWPTAVIARQWRIRSLRLNLLCRRRDWRVHRTPTMSSVYCRWISNSADEHKHSLSSSVLLSPWYLCQSPPLDWTVHIPSITALNWEPWGCVNLHRGIQWPVFKPIDDVPRRVTLIAPASPSGHGSNLTPMVSVSVRLCHFSHWRSRRLVLHPVMITVCGLKFCASREPYQVWILQRLCGDQMCCMWCIWSLLAWSAEFL